MADAVRAVALTGAPSVRHGEGAKNRRLDVQGLRAVAVLMVVAFHAGLPLPGGFVGVDVFFVISGFVITGMLRREWLATGGIRFGAFYARRFKRLTPALALTVSVTMLLSALMLSPFGPQQIAAKTAVGAMLLAANFVIAGSTGQYFDAPAETNPLLNTWSLSVEEQFYLAFPALLLIGWLTGRRLQRPVGSAILLVAIVAAFSFALAIIGQEVSGLGEAEYLFGFYSPFTRFWEFAAGALLTLAWSVATPSRQVATAMALIGFAMLALSLWVIAGTSQVPGPWTLLPVGGTLLLLAAGKQPANGGSRLLATRPLVRVGDWSYSLYLWHWPFVVFARILWPSSGLALVLAAVASLIPAVASYRWVEQPIRALTSLRGRRFAMLVAVTLAVPLTIAGVVGIAGPMGWSPEGLKDAAHDRVEEHAGRVRGCHISQAFDRQAISGCEWNADARGRPIYLVGDSNAEQFSEAAIGAGAILNRPVWIFTGSSCPLVDGLDLTVAATKSEFVSDPIPSTAFDHCQQYAEEVVRWLRTAPPGDVFIAAN
ncbi:MAG: acyltransferase family protein [Candidatus Nanopelagicales bacterium]